MPSVGNETNHRLDGLTVQGGLAIAGDAGITTYLTRDSAAATARQQTMLRAQGIYAETFSRLAASNGTISITGTVYLCGIPLLAGDIVSNMYVGATVAAASPTLTKCGLYNKTTLGLLASSADQSANFSTAGVKTLPMSTPYVVPTDDMYYAAFLGVHGGTAVTLLRGVTGVTSTQAAVFNVIGSGTGVMGVMTGQSDLPATATISFGGSPVGWWVGVS